MLAFTIAFYVVIYTMWLKRTKTRAEHRHWRRCWRFASHGRFCRGRGRSQPFELCAVCDHFRVDATTFLVASSAQVRGLWTRRRADVANVAGPDRTRLEILIYALLLGPLGTAPYLLGFASVAYGLISAICGVTLVGYAVAAYRRREGDAAKVAARRLFLFSILYLFALFLALVVERILHFLPLTLLPAWI